MQRNLLSPLLSLVTCMLLCLACGSPRDPAPDRAGEALQEQDQFPDTSTTDRMDTAHHPIMDGKP